MEKKLVLALQNLHIVDMKLEQELAAECLAGPFMSPPLPTFCSHRSV